MLIRYRSDNLGATKTYHFKGKAYIFPSDRWTPIDDLFLFEDLRRYPAVFDTVAFFDILPLKKIGKDITIKGDIISTSRRVIAEKLKRFNFIKYQAKRPEQGVYIFKIINYGSSDLTNYRGVKTGLNILAYRNLGGLGDILMTTSAIEKVKEKYPNSKITYACPKEFLPLLKHNPMIDRLSIYDREVTQEEYDVVINLTHDCIDYEIKHQPLVEQNRSEVFVSSCGLLDGSVPSPKIYLNENEIFWAGDFLKNRSAPTIGLVLTSNAKVRQWPYFKDLRKQLLKDYPTATILEISHVEPTDWKKHERVIPIFGFELRQVAALINQCDLIVSPDTGIAHIAGALGKPTVWLFTHIDGKIRTKNYTDSYVCQVTPSTCPKGMPCWYEIPCGKDMGDHRSFENTTNPVCATEMSVDMVMNICREVLAAHQVTYIVFKGNEKMEDIDEQISSSIGRTVLLIGEDQTISPLTMHRFMIADGDIVACKTEENHLYHSSTGKYKPQVSIGGLLISREAYQRVGKFSTTFLLEAQEKGLTINYIDNHEMEKEEFPIMIRVEENKILLLIRNGGLGDILMTTLVLKRLKQKYFNYKIYYFCDQAWMDLLKDNPYLDGVFNLKKLPKFPRYDACIDLIEAVENYYQGEKINRENRIDRFFKLCGVKGNGHYKFNYQVTDEESRKALSTLSSDGKKVLGLGLSAVAPYRNWSLAYYEELSRMVDSDEWQIFLFSDQTVEWSGSRADNLGGKLKIRELFAYLSICDVVVCGDTGIAHVCAVVDVPNIIFYGAIPSEARCKYYPKAYPMTSEDTPCIPCWDLQEGDKEMFRQCRTPSGAKCMRDIKPEQVLQKINSIAGG